MNPGETAASRSSQPNFAGGFDEFSDLGANRSTANDRGNLRRGRTAFAKAKTADTGTSQQSQADNT